jgi:hypothetical protein
MESTAQYWKPVWGALDPRDTLPALEIRIIDDKVGELRFRK